MNEERSSPSSELQPQLNGKKSLKIDLTNYYLPTHQNGIFNESAVNVKFRELNYSIEAGMFQKKKRTLLDNISGEFHGAELSAIMGPSGAGKSTLMDILAGYITKNVGGKIYSGSEIRDLTEFRKQSCYIMQDDNLQPLLTVHEAMMVAADLKLPRSLSKKKKNDMIQDVLSSVDLGQVQKVRTMALSGGQKKRLSIALELITNPQIMFFDEPTSGLDSVTSIQCVNLLKSLAINGKTIICTIHQPSATILTLFDHLYVVDKGYCVYQGSVNNLIPYLSDMGLTCPTFHNPADFLMEVLTEADENTKFDNRKLVTRCNNGRNKRWQRSKDGISPFPAPTPTPTTATMGNFMIYDYTPSYTANFFNQLQILIKRSFLIITRNKTLTLNRIGTHMIIALVIGVIFFGIGLEAGDMLNNFKFMFFSVMFLMLTSFNCITTTFPSELPIISREHFNRWYSLKSYYLAISITDIPIQMFATILYGSVTYGLTRQPVEFYRIISFLFMCILISLVSQSFGLFIGASMDVKNGVIFGPFCMLPFTIFSGFFLQLNTCPVSMRWLFHISFIKYGFEGIVLSILGYDRPKLPCNSEYCHYSQPGKFLSQMDMLESKYWLSVIFLISMFIVIRVIAYYILRFRIRHSRGKRF